MMYRGLETAAVLDIFILFLINPFQVCRKSSAYRLVSRHLTVSFEKLPKCLGNPQPNGNIPIPSHNVTPPRAKG